MLSIVFGGGILSWEYRPRGIVRGLLSWNVVWDYCPRTIKTIYHLTNIYRVKFEALESKQIQNHYIAHNSVLFTSMKL